MNNYKEIIRSLSKCVTACEFCIESCLNETNIDEMVDCIKLNRDCADICSAAIHILSRESDISTSLIKLCADICAYCAVECEKHKHEHCKKCAGACRSCEEACKSYLDNLRQIAMNS